MMARSGLESAGPPVVSTFSVNQRSNSSMSRSTSASTSPPTTSTLTGMPLNLPLVIAAVDLQRDLDDLVEMESDLFPDNNMNELTISTEVTHGKCLVVLFDNRAVGYSLVRHADGMLDVLRLGLLPAHRGRGTGRRLLVASIGKGAEAMLTVMKNNTPAICLYKSEGFRIVSEINASWVMHRPTWRER